MKRDRKTQQRTEFDPTDDPTDTNAAADASSPPGHGSDRSGSCTCYLWKRRRFLPRQRASSLLRVQRVDSPNRVYISARPWHGPIIFVTLACVNVHTHPTRSPRDVRGKQGERGAVTVLLGAAIVIVAYLVLQETKLSVAAADRARAQTAADAAALGGVVDGEETAADLARSNGATLLSYIDDGDEVQVQVGFNDAVATARAERSETSPFS